MGLKDKASKIDFASLMPASSPNPEAARPKTAPGAMMALANDQRSELLRENEALREKAARAADLEGQLGDAMAELQTWEGAKATRLIDPREIKRSDYANRHPSSFQGPAFESLKREIQEAGGNIQPIKVRAVSSNGEGPAYEIVFGHRRHEACLQLGLPVLVFVDNLDDRALFEEMERENRERADLSAWEQGVMYARALDRGLYPSLRQMASAIGVDPGNLSKALVLGRLPDGVLRAFGSPLDLQFRWASAFKAAMDNDAEGLEARARVLASDGVSRSAKEVFAALLSPAEGAAVVEPMVRVFEKGGVPLATVQVDKARKLTIRLHNGLSQERQRELIRLVERFVAES